MVRYLRTACLLVLFLAALAPARAADRYTLITLLHTNDLHGRIVTQNSGLARIATRIREIRAEMPNVILLDGGDIFLCTYIDYYAGGRATVAAMNAIGYDAGVIGNHELDLGEDVFHKLVASARFPFLSANLKSTTGGHVEGVKPYVILDVDGVRVGVLGLTTVDAVPWHWRASIPGIAEDDPVAVAKEIIPKLRKQVDVLVVLSHMGFGPDRELAKAVPGIDFIVGGHSHSPLDKWTWVGDTLISQAVSFGEAFGRIDFIVRTGDSGPKVMSVNGRYSDWNKKPPLGKHYPDRPLISLDATIPLDSKVREAYRVFEVAANKPFRSVIGTAGEAFPPKADGVPECALGDLAADAFRDWARTDVAIVDMAQSMYSGWPAGPIRPSEVFGLDLGGYTEHYVVSAKMKGADLLKTLQDSTTQRKAIGDCYSGLTLTYKIQNGAPVIGRVMIGGAAIDPARTYSVCAWSARMTQIERSVPTEVIPGELKTGRDVIIDYIRARGVLDAPTQGRVRQE